jgi:hypothetical protein
MNVLLMAALSGAWMTADSPYAHTTALPLAAPVPAPVQGPVPAPPPAQPPNTNPIPPPPANGGKDGPYESVIWAGIVARKHRLHHLRAEVRKEFDLWYVVYYPFP